MYSGLKPRIHLALESFFGSSARAIAWMDCSMPQHCDPILEAIIY